MLRCTRVPVGGRATLLCNAHQDGTLKDQGAPAVIQHLKTWAQGAPTILGGEFDADAQDPNVTQFYGIRGGSGAFVFVFVFVFVVVFVFVGASSLIGASLLSTARG